MLFYFDEAINAYVTSKTKCNLTFYVRKYLPINKHIHSNAFDSFYIFHTILKHFIDSDFLVSVKYPIVRRFCLSSSGDDKEVPVNFWVE